MNKNTCEFFAPIDDLGLVVTCGGEDDCCDLPRLTTRSTVAGFVAGGLEVEDGGISSDDVIREWWWDTDLHHLRRNLEGLGFQLVERKQDTYHADEDDGVNTLDEVWGRPEGQVCIESPDPRNPDATIMGRRVLANSWFFGTPVQSVLYGWEIIWF